MRVEGGNVWVVRHLDKAVRVPTKNAFDARKIGMTVLQCEPGDIVVKLDDGDGLDTSVKKYFGLVEVVIQKESAFVWRLPGETEWRRG
jgi:hypothetical protein